MLRLVFNVFGLFVLAWTRKCRVYSPWVSPKALSGEKIQILGGARIDASCEIGGNTYIGGYCYITRARIGRYVSIANNVSIGQGEHRLDRISTSAGFYSAPWEDLTAGECEIAADAWIGVDAVVLRGVRVGIGAVVGANAVVTKDVPDFAVVAGVPARIIKYRFGPSQRSRILDSKWWDLPSNEAKLAVEKIQYEFSEGI